MITDRPSSLVRNHDMNAAWRHIDGALLGFVGATVAFGLTLIHSATSNQEDPTQTASKQMLFVMLGVAAMSAVAAIDYRRLLDWARLIYPVTVLVLVAVLIPGVGAERKGIRAWFDLGPLQLQPSEFAKVAVILAAAAYFGRLERPPQLRHLVVGLVMFGLPMGLILLQPDLGTTLVFVMIAAAMFLCAGLPARLLIGLTIVGIVGVGALLSSSTLDQYQIDRLTAFADPDNAAEEVIYNTKQAQIAISSGGFSGKGYGQGDQTSGGFVPEQETDFIFTVAAEELGFLGASILLLLEGGIVWRVWRTAQLAADRSGTLICVGVMAMLMFHIFENVGMTLGIMPVTGIPLPFISYGGSSSIAAFVAIGLVLNVHMRRFD